MRSDRVLDALNFALAGAREGFGPFLGVYLQASGFAPAATGIAMSLAGLTGLLATTPIGIFIDRTPSKRALLAASVIAIAIGAVILVLTSRLWVIAAAQAVIGVGDAAVAPLISAVTLGIVGQARFGARMARNEGFNHAGNAANALLATALGFFLGLSWVAVAIVVMAVASTLMVTRIGASDIDHVKARGGETGERSIVAVLRQAPGLLLLSVVVLLFQTANGALLPFLAQARTVAGGNPSITTGVMVITARLAMVGAALLAPRLARHVGYRGAIVMVLIVTILRCLLAACGTGWAIVEPVEIMEGIATGLASVAIPALSTEIMVGTGRTTAALGAVLTAFGAGCAIGPLVAGIAAQHLGFSDAFIVLAAIAGAGLASWIAGSHRSGAHVASPEPGRG